MWGRLLSVRRRDAGLWVVCWGRCLEIFGVVFEMAHEGNLSAVLLVVVVVVVAVVGLVCVLVLVFLVFIVVLLVVFVLCICILFLIM